MAFIIVWKYRDAPKTHEDKVIARSWPEALLKWDCGAAEEIIRVYAT